MKIFLKKFEYVPHLIQQRTTMIPKQILKSIPKKLYLVIENDTDEILIEKSVIEDLNNTELPYTD